MKDNNNELKVIINWNKYWLLLIETIKKVKCLLKREKSYNEEKCTINVKKASNFLWLKM